MYVYIFQEEWLTRNLTNILESGSLRVLDMQTGDHGPSKVNTWGRNMSYLSVTILPVFGGKCDSESPQATMAASGREYVSPVTHSIL